LALTPLSYQQAIALLDSIPGINQRIAEIFLAEVGTDMQRFPTAGHLASWVGIVRCITHMSIPGAARKNSKGGSWVNGLPRVERQRGQEHATESGRKSEDA
jgi:transposase